MHYRPDQAKHKRPFHGAEQRLDLDRELSRRFVSAFEVLVQNLLLIFANSILRFARWSTSVSGRCPGKAPDA